MIEIARFPSGFTTKGHANYAEHGQDIVCASVSALVQTTILSLQEHSIASYTKLSDGVMVYVDSMVGSASDVIIDTMFIGLREIEKQYPDYVKIMEVEDYE